MKRFTLKVTIKKEEQRPKEEVKNEETTPFSCNYCGLSFKQVDHIIEHINGCYFQPNPRLNKSKFRISWMHRYHFWWPNKRFFWWLKSGLNTLYKLLEINVLRFCCQSYINMYVFEKENCILWNDEKYNGVLFTKSLHALNRVGQLNFLV